jgi:hypothetical protein
VLQYQGKYETAEEMNRRALAEYEKALGVEHPSTLTQCQLFGIGASILFKPLKPEVCESLPANVSRIPEVHAGLNVTPVIYFSYSSRALLRYPVQWTFLRNWKPRGSVPRSLTPLRQSF